MGDYEGALRSIIHAFKYDGRRSLARPLAALMADIAKPLIVDADFAVPVPLHPSKRRSRGFNQAEDLARYLPCPTLHALRRIRATAVQAELSAEDRRDNVNGAFAVRPAAATMLVGRTLMLVDDVSTTGATLDACASTLKDGGANAVFAVTAARVSSRSRR